MIAILTNTPAKDRMVQEAFFSRGFKWSHIGANLENYDPKWPYKFISSFPNKVIDGANENYFKNNEGDVDFISTEDFLENIDEYLEGKVIDNT